MSSLTSTPDWLEEIIPLPGGFREPVFLCRDKRTGAFVVSKIFENGYDSEDEDEPRMLTVYRKIPQHARLVECLEILPACREPKSFTIVLPFYNGGSLADLTKHSQFENEHLPEPFLWHLITQVLEGLQACFANEMSHNDLNSGNILLHFSHPISNSYPDAILADFGLRTRLSLSRAIHYDVEKFFGWVYLAIVSDSSKTLRYSKTILEWSETLSGQATSKGEITWEYFRAVNELLPRIPEYVEQCSEDSSMPDWMVSYFQSLQKSPEKVPLLRWQAGRARIQKALQSCYGKVESESSRPPTTGVTPSTNCLNLKEKMPPTPPQKALPSQLPTTPAATSSRHKPAAPAEPSFPDLKVPTDKLIPTLISYLDLPILPSDIPPPLAGKVSSEEELHHRKRIFECIIGTADARIKNSTTRRWAIDEGHRDAKAIHWHMAVMRECQKRGKELEDAFERDRRAKWEVWGGED